MTKKLTVRKGDGITRIAFKYGHFPETIWNDPANAELKQGRSHMDVLLAGDKVVVPDLRMNSIAGATDMRHRFKRKGVPAKFRLQLFVGEEPRANEHYRIDIDGKLKEGTTDGEGVLEEIVSPGALKALLIIGEEEARYELTFGHLDPPTELSGLQNRLANLGYDVGSADGVMGKRCKAALEEFQQVAGLEVTGEADQATVDELVRVHDLEGAPPEYEEEAEP